jgi:hypothetical protein
MARHRSKGNRSLRLHQYSRIPKGFQPRVDQAKRLAQEIIVAFEHFGTDPSHWRDGPARRRLEVNRQRLGVLIELVREQDPKRGQEVAVEIHNHLLQETQRVETKNRDANH